MPEKKDRQDSAVEIGGHFKKKPLHSCTVCDINKIAYFAERFHLHRNGILYGSLLKEVIV